MSGLIVGLVLRTPITEQFNTEAKFIATVYADHAWEDGTHAYPAVDTVASITGLSDRTVQRYLRLLETMGVLILDGKGPRGTNRYRFPLESHGDGSIRLAIRGGDSLTPPATEQKKPDSGDSVSPRQPDGGDTESGDTESGDTAMSPKQTNHHIVVVVNSGDVFKYFEQEIGVITPMIADAIKDACETYPIDWIPEAIEIAVTSNKRSWKYVEGILKNCKQKNIRPSLNKLEKNYAKTKPGNKPTSKPDAAPHYSEADRAAAERVRQRQKQRVPAV